MRKKNTKKKKREPEKEVGDDGGVQARDDGMELFRLKNKHTFKTDIADKSIST